jgi:hypothetical protein
MTEVEALRARINELYPKRQLGDLTEKAFQRELTERTVELYRALVKKKASPEESILKEHHVILAHTKLARSVLQEPEQETVSIFATDRRLFRIKSFLFPNLPPTGDGRDKTELDEVTYRRIGSLKVRREIRWGEMGVGAAMMVLAVLFYHALSLTGPVLIVLGFLGLLHGFLLPTRWLEVATFNSTPLSDPIKILALRKKSAREMVRLLREKTGGDYGGSKSPFGGR